MNAALIGCGLMGQQRARSLALLPERPRIAAVYDPNPDSAAALAGRLECAAAGSLNELLARQDYDIAIVGVPHYAAAETAIAALRAGKHVLCEKPLGLTVSDAERVVEEAERQGRTLTPGFNYRYYPGFQAAAQAVRDGAVGTVTHIRAELGHGARPGYEKEWKTSKKLCGGGALLDPGIHIVDLIRFLTGEIAGASAVLFRSYWDIDVEDNAMVMLEMSSGCQVQLHISITEWRSRCALDVFGTDGEIQVRGRSGFYGPQTFRLKKRWDWLEPRQEEVYSEFPADELSFAEEMKAFWSRVQGGNAPGLATGEDGIRALDVIEGLYRMVPVRAPLTSCPA